METTINNPVQRAYPPANQTITQNNTSTSSEKTSDQPEPENVKTSETAQSGDVERAKEQKDTVEIRSSNYNAVESDQESPENNAEAMRLIQGVKDMLNSGYEQEQIEQLHSLNGQQLVDLLV